LPADEVEWLVAQLRAIRRASEAAQSLAARIEWGRAEAEPFETTLEEKRALLEEFDQSPRARSRPLRELEIGLHAAVFSEQHPWA
jgi:hypothetical protein